jgi:hypothetical protein
MGWIKNLLSSTANTHEDLRPQREERFPSHTYGPGYPIVVHRQELEDLARLLEIESKAPDGWDNTMFLSREDFEDIVDNTVDDIGGGVPSPEERRGEIGEILELWQNQLTGSEDAVWTTFGTEYRFMIYITRCEARADTEDDSFEEPNELDTAREIFNRIKTAQNSDSKFAIVHKRDLPLQEPKEDPSETS